MCGQAYIAGIHDLTGAPWWATIVLATLGARAAMVPLMVMQSRCAAGRLVAVERPPTLTPATAHPVRARRHCSNVANMAKIKPTLDDLTERLKDAYANDNYESAARFQNQISDLMAKHNVKPYSTMVGAIVQVGGDRPQPMPAASAAHHARAFPVRARPLSQLAPPWCAGLPGRSPCG